MSSGNAGRGRSIAQKLGWGTLGAALSFLGPESALAAAPSIELSWSAPAGCPDREVVLRAIRDLVGESPTPQSPPEFWVRGQIEAHEDVFRLDLSWRTARDHAERAMSAKTCDELARAAALIVALAVNPERSDSATSRATVSNAEQSNAAWGSEPSSARSLDERRPPAPLEVTPLVRPEQLDHVEPPAKERAGLLRVRLRTQMAMDVGALPRTAVGLGIGAIIPLGLSALQTEALMFAPQSKSIPSGGGGEFWLAAFAARPCLPIERGRVRVMPCLTAELALINGEGEGLDFRDGGAAWFLRFGLGGDVAYALSKQMGLVLGAWLLATPFRPDFFVDETESVHRPASLGLRSTLGLELGL
jgi:hypothetical protein